MPWSVDITDTPANIGATLDTMQTALNSTPDRSLFNGTRLQIKLNLNLVTTAYARVTTSGGYDGFNSRVAWTIDPVIVDANKNVIQTL